MKRTLMLLLMAFAATTASAGNGAIGLSPAVVMLRGDHGQSTTQSLRISNGTSRTFSFELVALDVVTEEGKRKFVEAGSIPGSIAATAVFSHREVTLAPGATAAVELTITIPQASRQRAVVAMFRGTNQIGGGAAQFSASMGSLLTFTISEDIEMAATPLEIRPQTATANLAASHTCTNGGDEPLVVRGVLAVLDSRGNLVGKSQLPPHRLLPGESARLGGEYAGDLEPGEYRLLMTYDYEGRTLRRSAEVVIR
jgi:hypothetical protein